MWWQTNKSGRLHNKGCYHKGQYNVTLFCIKRLCIQNQKAHDNLCFPLRRAYLLLLCIYLLCKSQTISSIPFYFSLLQASCGGEISRHIYPVGYEWSWVIILDITLEVNELGGKIISPYLSMCLAETFAPYICRECQKS